ncbi:MAG: ABC transporter permease, partial [Flavobacteriaceae bacterium]|nr:ABC transporter permease [Flavobacteriaceae bacterium]
KINLIFWVSLIFLIVTWFLVTELKIVDPLFIPSPRDFVLALQDMFMRLGFARDIGISTFRVFSAFLLSLVCAVPLALAMSQVKWVRKLFEPYIDFIRYIPVPALIPITILFLGIGETAKIGLLFVGTFFQMILLIIDDINNIPQEYIELAKTLGYKKSQILKMKLRAILPQLYDNGRITLGWCWTYLVIAELVAAQAGVGFVIKEAQRFSETPRVYVAIITLGVLGFVIDSSLKRFKPLLFKYL